jgi:AcrR family transcriptional regulator
MTAYTAGENTKMKMINAAGELAAELGFPNVSTRAVAERSGENIGSIHYHFGGKAGLLEAVVCEAMKDMSGQGALRITEQFDEAKKTPAGLSGLLRMLVRRQVELLFNPDKPHWHSRVIYQLLQRDDGLYRLFKREMLDPDLDAMRWFLRAVDPSLSDEEVVLRTSLLFLPIFSHATYMPAMLQLLGIDRFSDEYLKQMEDLLVRQTQLLMGLPTDR